MSDGDDKHESNGQESGEVIQEPSNMDEEQHDCYLNRKRGRTLGDAERAQSGSATDGATRGENDAGVGDTRQMTTACNDEFGTPEPTANGKDLTRGTKRDRDVAADMRDKDNGMSVLPRHRRQQPPPKAGSLISAIVVICMRER